jgi:hypothetical protein
MPKVTRQDVKGETRIVVLFNGRERVRPSETMMTSKCTLEELKTMGDSIFIRNTNLQDMPFQRSGCVIWLPQEQVIALVIQAIGRRGYVYQLSPPPQPGSAAFTVDMDQDGICLEQVCGRPIVEFDMEKRFKTIDADGFVVPLVDSQGNIKCNVAGPDLGVCPGVEVPQSVLGWLQADTCCTYRRGPAEMVPVLYVSMDSRLEQRMQDVLVDPTTGEALMSVPIGEPVESQCPDRSVLRH